jgi:hypothetical protein
MDETTVETGVSRRDLIKKSAIAGGLIWAAPVVSSSAAWAQAGCPAPNCVEACDQCCPDEFRIYAKFAPGNANVTDQQCLAPSGDACPQVTTVQKISLSDLECAGLIDISDTVESQDSTAGFTILQPDILRVIRTSIKSTSNCLITRCEDGFSHITENTASTNPPCDQEHLTDNPSSYWGVNNNNPQTINPIFKFFSGPGGNTPCSETPTGASTAGSKDGTQCCSQVTKIEYDTTDLYARSNSQNNKTINFIEVMFCFKGGSPITGC